MAKTIIILMLPITPISLFDGSYQPPNFLKHFRALGIQRREVGVVLKVWSPEECAAFMSEFRTIAQKNEKTLEIIEKTRVFDSEVDGGRTRNLRIDSPVL